MTGGITPSISVCMATYNGERYLANQLRSILDQLGDHDEVVVSDDQSTDATLKIVKDFDDARLRILPATRVASPILNFENALNQVRGETIILADQDDVWLPNKVTLVRQLFAQRKFEAYAVVLDGVVVDAEGKELFPSIFDKLGSGPGIVKNIYDNTFLGCCMAFTRTSLELSLPFPATIPMHDMWIGLVTSVFGKVDFVREKTILYRKHGGSVTNFERQFRPWLQIQRRLFLSCNLAARSWQRKAFAKRATA